MKLETRLAALEEKMERVEIREEEYVAAARQVIDLQNQVGEMQGEIDMLKEHEEHVQEDLFELRGKMCRCATRGETSGDRSYVTAPGTDGGEADDEEEEKENCSPVWEPSSPTPSDRRARELSDEMDEEERRRAHSGRVVRRFSPYTRPRLRQTCIKSVPFGPNPRYE